MEIYSKIRIRYKSPEKFNPKFCVLDFLLIFSLHSTFILNGGKFLINFYIDKFPKFEYIAFYELDIIPFIFK